MRFLQCSDIHLNMIPDPDFPWGKDRANAIRSTFRRCVEKAGEISADCLLLPGNLFHHPPLSHDLQELNQLFRQIPRTRVILISGSEDRVTENSALLSFDWAENVHWLSESGARLYFDEINAEFTGITGTPDTLREQLAAAEAAAQTPADASHDPIRVLLFCDSSRQSTPAIAAFRDLPFDYIALGGFHQPAEYRELPLLGAGSPEPLGAMDEGVHGVYIGDISAITHRLQRLEFCPMATLSYRTLSALLRPDSEPEKLLQELTAQIEKLGREDIYTLRLSGSCPLELAPLLGEGLRRFRILDILDETESGYDFEALYREHPTDLIGYYIRSFLRKDESPETLSLTERQALDYGIRALLQTEKEENA